MNIDYIIEYISLKQINLEEEQRITSIAAGLVSAFKDVVGELYDESELGSL